MGLEDARVFLTDKGIDVDTIAPQVEGKFMSGFMRAVAEAIGQMRIAVRNQLSLWRDGGV